MTSNPSISTSIKSERLTNNNSNSSSKVKANQIYNKSISPSLDTVRLSHNHTISSQNKQVKFLPDDKSADESNILS